MYPHPRSFASHSNNPPVSHYTHHSPPSYHHGHGRNTSSSHLHVLQNPPQSGGNHANYMQQSSSRNQHYQPYYPSPASVGFGQDVYGTLINDGEIVEGGGGGGGGSGVGGGGGHSNGSGMRSRSSHPATGSRSRPADQASTPKSSASSNDHRPNWGLFSRQMSQIAGDVSTSVRQNELVITLLERLIERVDGGGAMQSNPSIMQGRMGHDIDGDAARGASRGASRRPQQQQQQQQGGYDEAVSADANRSREESSIRHSSSIMNNAHQHGGSGNANASTQPSTSHSVPSYLDNDLGSSSFDFSNSSNMSHRTQYPSALNHHRFDADIPPKRTPPTVSFMLSGDVNPPLHSSASSHALPTTHSFSSVTSNPRQQPHSATSSHQQGSHTNDSMTGSGNVTLDESYNRLPSPVFSESAPADHEPPAALGLTHYYGGDDEENPSPIHPDALHQHGMLVQPPTPIHPTIERQDSRGRLTVLQSAGMGSLEDAGLIPISSTSSNNVTPAPRARQAVEAEEVADQSMNNSMAYSAADGDQSQQVEEVANSDWTLWQTPKPPETPLAVPSKYRSIKQVKNERKEKTKRSISTIGRIPLKEYLEVGSDYKAVRRMARTVYNTWLALNVRLAKQDPDRLRACYHKLEYEYPILGDCEDHWKAKELMLQVIDNAIDEIAFHRRKEERKQQEEGQEEAAANANTAGNTASNSNTNHNTNNGDAAILRRDATAADLYTNEEERPNTRRRRGAGSNARDKSNEEDGAAASSNTTQHQQNWEGANLFTQSSTATQEQQQAPAHKARRAQQQTTTAGWH